MVDKKSVAAQLKRIGFNERAWGRQEVRELPNIILQDEEIFECVNGIYEGGFALLVATDVRVLLIDKKPFNYLTVEDLRFDMINEIDYNHRAFGAYVDITTGNRELKFRSYNQQRLRNLIGHVQRRMAEIKRKLDSHQEGQNQHLEQINTHLHTYLMEQYKHQEDLRRQLEEAQRGDAHAAAAQLKPPPRPSPELSDYLFAHGLLEQYQAQNPGLDLNPNLSGELLEAGLKEVFGDKGAPAPSVAAADVPVDLNALNAALPASPTTQGQGQGHHHPHVFDINPLKIAYSKLPMALRSRKFGRPSPYPSLQPELD